MTVFPTTTSSTTATAVTAVTAKRKRTQGKNKSKKPKCSATFVTIDGNNALQFYSKSKFPDAKYLSNFTEYGSTSVEKEFCKAKYKHCRVQCPDLNNLTGAEVKGRHGKKYLFMPPLAIASWNREAPGIMRTLILNRCQADPAFAELLSKYKYFLHQENRGKKPYWGGRVKNGILVGKNKLGTIFSQIAMNLGKPVDPFTKVNHKYYDLKDYESSDEIFSVGEYDLQDPFISEADANLKDYESSDEIFSVGKYDLQDPFISEAEK